MRTFVTGLMAAVALAAAHPADATTVLGSFSGTVTAGTARGNFGFDALTDLTGRRITGTFSYDTALLGPDCAPGAGFFGCFLGTGMSITQTINGVDEVFPGSPAVPGAGLAFNTAESGLLLYDLVGDAVNLHTLARIGTPASVYNEHETGLAFGLAPGGIGDTGNPVLAYDGPSDGPVYGYVIGGQRFDVNHSRIYQLTGGFFTQFTSYDFVVDHVTFGAPSPMGVPEPGSWALMILGLGAAGAMLRRRGRAFPRQFT